MSTTQTTGDPTAGTPSRSSADMRLEVVIVPVTDVDRAKAFYETLGWRMDIDYVGSDDFRVVQLTPHGSGASIIIGEGITSTSPGSIDGLQLVVPDIDAAIVDLRSRGVDVSDAFHDADGVFHHAGSERRATGAHPDRASYGSFASFNDPDGNGWMIQEVTTRAPGR